MNAPNCNQRISAEQAMAGTFSHFNESQRREFWAALALKHTPGLGNKGCVTLAQAFGSAYAAVCNHSKWRRHGTSDAIVEQFDLEVWRKSAGEEWATVKLHNQDILLWTNPYYPQHLKDTPAAPLFLYYKGNIELLSNPGVGVVGSRACSSDGLAASSRISHELSRAGITVISGLARGVDREAHLAALKGPGSTIAVLATGLDVYYPKESSHIQEEIGRQGLLLTEYPPGTTPETFYFPVRNRIISALSLGVLVVEAAARSGSLITARLALEYGREVFAIPGKFAASKAQGCHSLIRRGAKPVLDIEDVLIELLPKFTEHLACTDAKKNFMQKQKTATTSGMDRSKVDKKPKMSKSNCEASLSSDDEFLADLPQKGLPPPVKTNEQKTSKSLPQKDSRQTYPTGKKGTLNQRIVELLEQEGPLQVDSICAMLNTCASKISSQLVFLELEGKVKRYPGMIYSVQ